MQAAYSAAIDWGDGTQVVWGSLVYDPVNQVWDVQGSHTYALAGNYTVAVTIGDGVGDSAWPGIATVATVQPTYATVERK